MSEDSKQTLPKLRTFAQDLERAQKMSGQPLSPDVKVPVAQPKKPSTPTQAVSSKNEPVAETETTHIPAFHELQKKGGVHAAEQKQPIVHKGPTITVGAPPTPAPTPKKIQVRAKKRDIPTEKKITSGGTVITDTKKGNFKLLPSIAASIDRWFSGIGKMFAPKKAPTYSITATERRKGVIQKATSKTGTIFTADNETLKEEIRRRQQHGSHRTDPHDGKTEILWTPRTESGYALLSGEHTASTPHVVITDKNVMVEFKKRAVPPPPTIVEPSKPQSVETELPAPSIPYVPPTPSILEEPPVDEVAFEDEPEPTPPLEEEIPEENPQVDDVGMTIPEESGPSPSWSSIRTFRDVSTLRTNTLAIGVVGLLTFIVILVIIVRVVLAVLLPERVSELSVEPAVPLTASSVVVDVALPTLTAEALLESVRANAVSDASTEFRFIGPSGEVLSPEVLFGLLGFSVNPNFIQSVSDVHVGVAVQKRALVFKVSDNTTALGSLLAWEDAMLSEVAPILGIATPDISTESFMDRAYQDIDVRILRTGETTVLVYGFTDDNTVVITSDLNTFIELLGE
jgi:hypothetical protein